MSSDYRRHEIRHAAQVVADAIVPKLDAMTRHCANCDHMQVATEVCKIAGERPPLKVLVVGCPRWEEQIPF